MTGRSSLPFVSLMAVIGLIIVCLLSSFSSSADEGGTDPNIKVYGAAGGGGFKWNDTHAFLLEDYGEKVEEEFDITICEDVKYKGGKYAPSGHIFGELKELRQQEFIQREYVV